MKKFLLKMLLGMLITVSSFSQDSLIKGFPIKGVVTLVSYDYKVKPYPSTFLGKEFTFSERYGMDILIGNHGKTPIVPTAKVNVLFHVLPKTTVKIGLNVVNNNGLYSGFGYGIDYDIYKGYNIGLESFYNDSIIERSYNLNISKEF